MNGEKSQQRVGSLRGRWRRLPWFVRKLPLAALILVAFVDRWCADDQVDPAFVAG